MKPAPAWQAIAVFAFLLLASASWVGCDPANPGPPTHSNGVRIERTGP